MHQAVYPRVRTGDWIETASGEKFYPLDPDPSEINPWDIAHALANICRWGGHCKTFYSVAQHSLWVSKLVSPENRKWALLHDAAEAYIGDMVWPLKHYGDFAAEFRAAEQRIMAAICERFHLPLEMPEEVKTADLIMLVTERRDLTQNRNEWKREVPMALPRRVYPVRPHTARNQYLAALAAAGVS